MVCDMNDRINHVNDRHWQLLFCCQWRNHKRFTRWQLRLQYTQTSPSDTWKWKRTGNKFELQASSITTHTMHASSPMCMRTLLCVIGSELETNWKHIGNILETYWKHIGTIRHTMHATSPMCMQTLLCRFGNELGRNWKHIGNILETYWKHHAYHACKLLRVHKV